LRKQWQKEIHAKNPGLSDRPVSLPVVTCGITHAISTFADLWTNPGDTVLLPDMMWGNYNMILSVRKGVSIAHFPLFNEKGGFNLEGFEAKARELAQKDGKLIVLMNFPHNPTGYTATEKEGQALAAVLTGIAESGANVIVACDDSYFGLFYEPDVMKESLFAKICGRHPRLLPIKLDGATKEIYVWGLRVGFITYGCAAESNLSGIHDALEKKTAGCIRGNISNASHLSQSITVKCLQSDTYLSEKKEKFEILKNKAARVKAVLADPKYAAAWDVYPFNSGYFMCIRLKTVNAEKLRVHLLDKYGVGLISIGDHDLRVAFSCIEEKDVQLLFDTVLKGVGELEQ
jgi:aspartate/methionine/tyrosine aminotransferase